MGDDAESPLDRSARVGFGTNPLDRLSGLRDDPRLVEALSRDPAARSVVIVADRPVSKRLGARLDPLFALDEIAGLGPARETALLGRTAAGPVFAALLDDSAVTIADPGGQATILDRRAIVMPGRDDLALTDLRSIAVQGLVSSELIGILGQAKSLMYWHARHRFCPNCGAPTRTAGAGWRRECDACAAQHFPRTDPVVIMLAVDGDECLLGRQPRFPPGMYSCLAGFLEAGETIEAAVRREILEEAGIAAGQVRYLASQPWPFPSSLMIGCLAAALTRDIVIDGQELEHARWFSRDEVRSMLAERHPGGLAAPQPMAIAHQIIHAWAIEEQAV